mmetsp:Transcript_56138/g.149820  ORF Transcript_56138/g.149820 Transcript_56138/m.149820 type:complete len:279 (-) Transcript_56138:94-930(-)
MTPGWLTMSVLTPMLMDSHGISRKTPCASLQPMRSSMVLNACVGGATTSCGVTKVKKLKTRRSAWPSQCDRATLCWTRRIPLVITTGYSLYLTSGLWRTSVSFPRSPSRVGRHRALGKDLPWVKRCTTWRGHRGWPGNCRKFDEGGEATVSALLRWPFQGSHREGAFPLHRALHSVSGVVRSSHPGGFECSLGTFFFMKRACQRFPRYWLPSTPVSPRTREPPVQPCARPFCACLRMRARVRARIRGRRCALRCKPSAADGGSQSAGKVRMHSPILLR